MKILITQNELNELFGLTDHIMFIPITLLILKTNLLFIKPKNVAKLISGYCKLIQVV